MKISVIITSYNEGEEVKSTIDSVRQNTSNVEIILVDDASTDGSCEEVGADILVRHDTRIGIAPSRIDGVAKATGEVYGFLDAHQRLTEGCFDECAKLAVERQAIVWPDVCGLGKSRWMGHGANMRQKQGNKRGLFDGRWKRTKPLDRVSRCSTMIVPGYVVPSSIWPKIRLIDQLAQHGASEAALTVPAFFADIPILHLCEHLARHKFNSRMPYNTSWKICARNHALVARVFFDEDTWKNYWWPKVFKRQLKTSDDQYFWQEQIVQRHKEFQSIKQRPDEEFWRGLMLTEFPLSKSRLVA